MSENLNMNETATAWAEIVLKIWEEQIKEYDAIYSWQLIDSLQQHVHLHANGNPSRIEFFYKYYGKFVDMGVGMGVNLQNQEALLLLEQTNRKAKPWFSQTFFYQVRVLGEILARKYAHKGAVSIVANMDDNAEKHEKRWETI
jgi:hypothetical protein